MSRTQNLRWKRKAIVTGVIAVSFAGYAGLGGSTVSAANYGEWDCSQYGASVVGSNDQPCTESTDGSYDSVPDETIPDTIPEDSIPEDSVPVDTTPVETDPPTTVTQPTGQQFPPSPTAAPATPAPAVVPAQVLPQTISTISTISTTPSLPVTGRGSALPTAFIAIGLLGAGSVALAFARRNSAGRTNES